MFMKQIFGMYLLKQLMEKELQVRLYMYLFLSSARCNRTFHCDKNDCQLITECFCIESYIRF